MLSVVCAELLHPSTFDNRELANEPFDGASKIAGVVKFFGN